MSSVCAELLTWGNLGRRLARMSLLVPAAAALKYGNMLESRVIGQQLTAESELARTPGIRLSN